MSKTDISEMEYQKGYDDGLDQGWADREAIAVKSLIEKDVYIDKLEQQNAELVKALRIIRNGALRYSAVGIERIAQEALTQHYNEAMKDEEVKKTYQTEAEQIAESVIDFYGSGCIEKAFKDLIELCKRADEQINKSKNKSTEDE